MSNLVEVEVNLIEKVQFIAKNSNGYSAILDGPSSIGGNGQGIRPMELILMGLAGCTSFDIINILQKQKIKLGLFKVAVQGLRSDATPSVYTDIKLIFEVDSQIPKNKLEKAIQLSMEKYCSVSAMLSPTVKITSEIKVISE